MEPTQVPQLVKSLGIAFLMLTHIQFAAFLIGAFGLAVAAELLGMLNPGQPSFDRFARSLGRATVILYSSGAVLAIVFILVVSLVFPTFWYTLMQISFWPLYLEAITFALTILYLFPWYYTWDRLAGLKPVHVSMGLALILVAQLQQGMIDIQAAYMLTPTPPGDLLRLFMSPATLPLNAHRLAGDFSFAGFVVAGYAAIRALRAREPERRAYYDWMGNLGFLAGLGFLFLQPAIGLSFLEEIRVNTPGAFNSMMRGRLSWVFLVLSGFFALLFCLSIYYMLLQVRKSGRRGQGLISGLLVVAVLSGLLLIQPYVIGPSQDYMWIDWVNPIGAMQPWKYIALAGLTLAALFALFSYTGSQRRGLRWGEMGLGGRRAQYVLAFVAILTSITMLTMGYVRESSRGPYLIYYRMRIDQPERFPQIPMTPTPPASASHRPPAAGAALTSLQIGRHGP